MNDQHLILALRSKLIQLRYRSQQLPALAAISLLVLLSACSHRYDVFKIESSQLELDQQAYFHRDSLVEIAYDFWNQDGKPFIAIRNNTERMLFLDLEKSSGLWRNNPVSLGTILLGQRGPVTQVALRNMHPNLPFERFDNSMCMAIAPGAWVSFVSLGFRSNLVSSKRPTQYQNIYNFRFVDEFQKDIRYQHHCSAGFVTQLKPHELMSVTEANGSKPNLFFYLKGSSGETLASAVAQGVSEGLLLYMDSQ